MLKLLLFLPCLVWATQIEISKNMLTMHYFDQPVVSEKYSNKVGFEGKLISNPVLTIGVMERDKSIYSTHNFLIGVDSIASPIIGYLHTTGMYLSEEFRLGLAVGAYSTVDSNWTERGLVMAHGFKFLGGYSIIPLVGLEASLRFKIAKDVSLGLTNIIGPVISNHAITLALEF